MALQEKWGESYWEIWLSKPNYMLRYPIVIETQSMSNLRTHYRLISSWRREDDISANLFKQANKHLNHHQMIASGFWDCILASAFHFFYSAQTQTWLVTETNMLLIWKSWDLSITEVFWVHRLRMSTNVYIFQSGPKWWTDRPIDNIAMNPTACVSKNETNIRKLLKL